ncbi:hypothetical protein C1H57_20345 [Clostridium sp. 2-1]|nr:hypothetical protein C1H57_20345 [Clostridium sp. 2-1]
MVKRMIESYEQSL